MLHTSVYFSLIALMISASPPANTAVMLSSSAGVLLTIHQVQNETEFVRSVEGIGHTHYKRTVLEGKEQRVHLGQKAKYCLEKLKIHAIFFL